MEGGASVAATGVKIVAKNQKAYHEYFIEEKFETGIELSGTEVKSIRLGNLSLKEACFAHCRLSTQSCPRCR